MQVFERRKTEGKVYALPIDKIDPSPYQARRIFDESELAGLARGIQENGLLQPGAVGRVGGGRGGVI